jgi:SMC interacting uncharacterized protein involved in chromosome segregation
MLSGAKAPEQFFQALSEADNLCRELDATAELRCQIDELTDELREAKQHAEDLFVEMGRQATRADRAEARLALARSERDTARAQGSRA